MRDKLKKYGLSVGAFLLSLVAALFWVALRINHSGISKFLGADNNPSFLIMNLPVMVCVVAWIGCALAAAGLLRGEKGRGLSVAGLIIGAVMTVAAVVVIFFGAFDYLRFILPHFLESLLVAAAIGGFGLILFFPPRWSKAAKCAVIAGVILVAVVLGYQLKPCSFTYGAVVYAVEDDYQIVFSTSDSAIAWVEIGGECYYDLYAGSMKSVDGVHKIEVPQEVLDAAGGYTVCAKQMIYRGPFGGYTGKTISRSYDFRVVDASDGLTYFSMSDVHEAVDPAIAAAKAAGELDFIVMIGDLVSMVETEKDAQLANELAHGVTGGEIPVIYARGNHEIKGEYAEVLYKYVGSRHQEYAYWVTLGDAVFATVLDMGEDHADDYWEYYGTARFDIYRQQQSEMLKQILADGAYEAYDYRMAICHIPIVYVDRNGYFETFRNEWTALLNEMEMDVCLSGHKHVMWPLLPGQVEQNTSPMALNPDFSGAEGKTDKGYLTAFEFPAILVGRRSLELTGDTQKYGYSQYVGLLTAVDPEGNTQTFRYINSLGQTPTGYFPFTEGSYTEIVTELN